MLGDGGRSLDGLSRAELLERTRAARFLLNVMGFVRDPEVLAAARRRVFLDIDPGFGQVWKELGLADVFAGHDDFVTVGRNVGSDGCGVPTCGLRWLTIPHPVVLARCPVAPGGNDFTSVGSWRGPYDRIEYDGQSLGLRVHEFRKFVELPSRVDASFRVALEIDASDANDLESLRENGWLLVDPSEVVPDPGAYLRFVQGSAAELTVAKGIYVTLATGWLGDRTACYLASGKPALVQDTGLAAHYPLGEGLLTFSTLDEAVAGAERSSPTTRSTRERPACLPKGARRAARPPASARGARVVTRTKRRGWRSTFATSSACCCTGIRVRTSCASGSRRIRDGMLEREVFSRFVSSEEYRSTHRVVPGFLTATTTRPWSIRTS